MPVKATDLTVGRNAQGRFGRQGQLSGISDYALPSRLHLQHKHVHNIQKEGDQQ
jgi:hypothetical protein